jgi:4-amino-4-deoxy-L-arabinose transferase-like glycosyltransferase
VTNWNRICFWAAWVLACWCLVALVAGILPPWLALPLAAVNAGNCVILYLRGDP